MTRHLQLFLMLILTCRLSAQSLLGLVPYDMTLEEDTTPRLLDVNRMLGGVSNLSLNADSLRMPENLVVTEEEMPWVRKMRQAQGLMFSNRFEEAVTLFRQVNDQYPENRLVRISMADCLYSLDRYEEAVRLYEGVLEEYPHDYLAMNNLAWLRSTASFPAFRDGEQAIALSSKAVIRAPGNYHVWSTLSEAFYVSGRYKEALDAAAEALRRAQLEEAKDLNLAVYINQVEKCRAAWLATSILE